MKRGATYSFLIRSGLALLLLLAPQLLSAQEDSARTIVHDSLQIEPISKLLLSPIEFQPMELSPFDLSPSELLLERPKKEFSLQPIAKPFYNFTFKRSFGQLPYQTNPSLLFKGDYRTGGVLQRWENGTLFASGSQTSIPGIGRFNDASLNYQHALNDRFSFQVGIDAMKINRMLTTGQVFTTSGSLMYRASDRIGFKVFGSYDLGNSYGMSTNRYGATMIMDMTDRFGMEVGVQRYYNSMRGGWETVPVAIPYYKFNEKFKLGVDVGGIIYEILRSTVFKPQNWGGGATIAPPRFQP